MNQSEPISQALGLGAEGPVLESPRPEAAGRPEKQQKHDGIRFLKRGERVPVEPPRRYTKGQKYVRLRWKIGKRQYCEVWEHRVRNGLVFDGIVHHENGDKHDNSDSNLCPCKTTAEHCKHHRRLDHNRIAELYQSGLTVTQIEDMFSSKSGVISRILKSEGVKARFGFGKPGNRRIAVNENLVMQIFNTCGNVSETSRRSEISRHIVERVLLEHSLIERHHRTRP